MERNFRKFFCPNPNFSKVLPHWKGYRSTDDDEDEGDGLDGPGLGGQQL